VIATRALIVYSAISIPLHGKPLKSVIVDRDQRFQDTNRSNNEWKAL